MKVGGLTEDQLRNLPAPSVIETLDYEGILTECKASLQELEPDLDVHDLPESDPIVKILEILAYRELYFRQRVNEAIRSGLAETTIGELPESPAEPDFNTAGSAAAYEYLARQAAGDEIADVSVRCDQSGRIDVILLGTDGERLDSDVLLVVGDYLNREDIRPITHLVSPTECAIEPYEVRARLGVYSAPGARAALEAARQSLQDYVTRQYRIGGSVFRDGLVGALSLPGIRYVILDAPDTDVPPEGREIRSAPFCTSSDIGIDIEPPDDLDDSALVQSFDQEERTFELTIEPPEHEARLTHYAVYWGNEQGEKLAGQPPLAEIRAGSGGSVRLPADSPSPGGARFVLVFAANQNGESRKPARWQPSDKPGGRQ